MDELEKLYKELELVQSMSEDAVCMRFNADSKKEYIDVLNEEIDYLESQLDYLDNDDYDGYDECELERERTNLCVSQGISRFC